MRRSLPRILALPCLALAILTFARPARAHIHLEESRPADGDSLAAAPTVIWLRFNEPAEAALSQIRLLGARRELTLVVRVDPADPNALVADVPGALEPGAYQVVWRAVSADGHRVEGAFVFLVEAATRPPPDATTVPPDATTAPPGPRPASAEQSAGPVSWPLGLLRGAAIGVLLALAGTLAFAAWLSPEDASPRAPVGLALAATLLLAAHAVAWIGYVSGGLSGAALSAALGTLPGRLEAFRVLLALLALVMLAFFRRPGPAAVLALAAVLVTSGLGHAATRAPKWSVPVKAVHLVGVTVWLGGLLHLAVDALRRSTALAHASRVASIALCAVLVAAFTGVVQAWLNLSGFADVVRTPYGILVLAKAAGLAVLVLFGARNRYRLIPRLHAGGGGAALERSVRWEIAVVALVVLVAGLLAYTPIPSE